MMIRTASGELSCSRRKETVTLWRFLQGENQRRQSKNGDDSDIDPPHAGPRGRARIEASTRFMVTHRANAVHSVSQAPYRPSAWTT
jgi:hypothetical protein